MIIRIEKKLRYLSDKRGFTLIEMAIVLIIIGIIIGAVIKGKDLIRSAEQKKIYTKYLNAWRMAYDNFYDRTGKRLGDFYNTLGSSVGQDGKADTDSNNDGSVSDAERGYLKTGEPAGTGFKGLDNVGLTSPSTNTGNCWEYTYTDKDGGGHRVAVAFKYDPVGKYNYMWITNLPNELGMALDTIIDGEANGTSGDFLCFDPGDSVNADWKDPSTEVSARWKMDF
jgi:prepilin-type N-terminal cleavage/methylation domain-containing protein